MGQLFLALAVFGPPALVLIFVFAFALIVVCLRTPQPLLSLDFQLSSLTLILVKITAEIVGGHGGGEDQSVLMGSIVTIY